MTIKKLPQDKTPADYGWGAKEYELIQKLASQGLRLGAIGKRLGTGKRGMEGVLARNEEAKDAYETGRDLLREELDGVVLKRAKTGSVHHLKMAYWLLFKEGTSESSDKGKSGEGGLTINVVHAVGESSNDTLLSQKKSEIIEGVAYEIQDAENGQSS